MKSINPSVEILRTGLETEFCTPEQFIEKVGRTCYKSEDKITDDSAAKFVGNLIKRGHEAMIEHWDLVFKADYTTCERIVMVCNPHLRWTFRLENFDYPAIISGNVRAWRDTIKAHIDEFGYFPQFLFSIVRDYPIFFPEYQHLLPETFDDSLFVPVSFSDLNEEERRVHQSITVKFICDRGVSHELVRHRVASFAQESTRYCNYSLDKFGREITVIRPSWCVEGSDAYKTWKVSCEIEEAAYFNMLDVGCTPQEARSVLPNSTKTEVVMTMTRRWWDHFFDLRCDKAAHPDMQEVAGLCEELFELEGL